MSRSFVLTLCINALNSSHQTCTQLPCSLLSQEEFVEVLELEREHLSCNRTGQTNLTDVQLALFRNMSYASCYSLGFLEIIPCRQVPRGIRINGANVTKDERPQAEQDVLSAVCETLETVDLECAGVEEPEVPIDNSTMSDNSTMPDNSTMDKVPEVPIDNSTMGCTQQMKLVDENGDNQLDFDEYQELVTLRRTECVRGIPGLEAILKGTYDSIVCHDCEDSPTGSDCLDCVAAGENTIEIAASGIQSRHAPIVSICDTIDLLTCPKETDAPVSSPVDAPSDRDRSLAPSQLKSSVELSALLVLPFLL